MKQGNWIDDLRQREQFREDNQLPDGLFDDIMAQVPQPKAERKAGFWLRRGAIAAAAVAALLIGIDVALNDDTAVELTQPVAQLSATTAAPAQSEAEEPSQSMAQSVITKTKKTLAAITLRHDEATTASSVGSETTSIVAQTEEITVIENTENKEEKTAVATSSPTRKANPYTGGQTLADNFDYKQKSKRHALSASVYASGSGSSNGGFGDDATLMASNDYIGSSIYNTTDADWGVSQEPTETSEMASSGLEAKHDIPLRFGVAVAVGITDRLSVESGVNYTRLGSEIDNPMGVGYASYKQTLHYIGVPLRLNYALWQNENIKVYVKAGAMAEKMVASSIENNSSVDVASPSENRLQFSVGAAAGASISIAKPVSLYVEPGVSHYFDNGSSIISIYKDRPTTFDLTLGLRIGF